MKWIFILRRQHNRKVYIDILCCYSADKKIKFEVTKMDETLQEERAEVRIIVDKGSLKAIESAIELLTELKPKLPDLSKEKVEEAIELMAQAREKILPELPTLKELVEVLGEREAEVKVRFNSLTLDGEAHMVVTPLKRMQ
jgi:hypothetical protein